MGGVVKVEKQAFLFLPKLTSTLKRIFEFLVVTLTTKIVKAREKKIM